MSHTDAAPPRRRIFDRPWLLLTLPPLFWAGNAIVGRAVAGHVPPLGLAFWRWFIGVLIVLPFAWPHLRRDAAALRRHWRIVLLLAGLGIAVFNSLLYIGLNTTTALNGVMIQSSMPVLIVLMTFLLFGDRITPLQAAGIAVSLTGAVILIARGDPAVLLDLAFNRGDLWIAAAVVCYAGYTALLRKRPAVHPLSFLVATFALGAAMVLPFHLWESWAGRPMLATPVTFAAIAYVAVFPSILAYLCYNRAVERVGANRTGLAIHLVPVFGSILAILFLGETLHVFHAAGIALIAIGIGLANRRR